MACNVGIYIFDEIEVLDLGGPFEVFSTASRLKVRLQPGFDITNHPAIDLFIVPGGVVTAELKRDAIVGWIARIASQSTITASVCTGAFLLGQAGLLRGKTITTHWEDIADFRSMFPAIPVQDDRRWVDAGTIVTSAGISAGLDMSLHLVARLEGEELAVRTARQMDYEWQRSAQPAS